MEWKWTSKALSDLARRVGEQLVELGCRRKALKMPSTPIGVNAKSGLVLTIMSPAAKVSDVTQVSTRLPGEEQSVFGDAGDQGVEKRNENQNCQVDGFIALRLSKRRALPDNTRGRMDDMIEKRKATVRAQL